MTKATQHANTTMGFLSVVEHPQHGLFGGYLLLNATGRPLEFHCTAPIKANRAQEILYGPTLESFLYGEQIGRTLLEQAKSPPSVVWTDRLSALAVRQHVSSPVALVVSDDAPADLSAEPPREQTFRVDAAHGRGPQLMHFQLGSNRLAVLESSADDRQQITQAMAELVETFDLAEPFGRIREAIDEAQQAVRTT